MPTLPTLSHSTAYFVQGVKLQLATLAESYLLKDELKLNPAAVSLVFSIAHLPWILKPLYGMVSDAHPLPFPGSARRERRRPYLVLCGLGGAAAFALLALSPPSRNLALACMTAGELAIAFSDVVIDALVVERARRAAGDVRRAPVPVLGGASGGEPVERVDGGGADTGGGAKARAGADGGVSTSHRCRRAVGG